MNKVKYNLKNTHYAKQEVAEDGTITYAKPVPIPGSVSISLEAQGSVDKFYADGIVYYTSSTNNGYEGELEIAMLPESFRIDILGEELDSKKVLIEKADSKQSNFALLFEFDGDVKAIRNVLYNCTASRPAVESNTRTDTIEPVTEKFTVTATALPDGRIKGRTGDTTDDAAYSSWYDAVHMTTGGAA